MQQTVELIAALSGAVSAIVAVVALVTGWKIRNTKNSYPPPPPPPYTNNFINQPQSVSQNANEVIQPESNETIQLPPEIQRVKEMAQPESNEIIQSQPKIQDINEVVQPELKTKKDAYPEGYLPKNRRKTLLFCIFLGMFGAHRIYVGKIRTAFFFIITHILFSVIATLAIMGSDSLVIVIGFLAFLYGASMIALFVWVIVDLIKICRGKFKDKNGYPLVNGIYCTSCGNITKKNTLCCPSCGAMQCSPKNWKTALLFCIFLGVFGGHRFYVEKTGTAILMIVVTIFTSGMGGLIWWVVDIVAICTGEFKDKQGRYLFPKTEKH